MCLKIIKGKKKRRKFIDLEVGPTVRAAPYWRPIANSGQISHFIEEFGGDDNKNAYIYIHISADMNDIPRDTLYGKAESYITLVWSDGLAYKSHSIDQKDLLGLGNLQMHKWEREAAFDRSYYFSWRTQSSMKTPERPAEQSMPSVSLLAPATIVLLFLLHQLLLGPAGIGSWGSSLQWHASFGGPCSFFRLYERLVLLLSLSSLSRFLSSSPSPA